MSGFLRTGNGKVKKRLRSFGNIKEVEDNMMDSKAQRERERRFREKDLPFGVFTIQTKTKWFNLIEMRNVLRELRVEDKSAVIDIGCSDGRFLEYLHDRLPKCRLTGIDFAESALNVLKGKGFPCDVVCGDICEMSFQQDSFDHAVAIQVIQSIPSREDRSNVLKNIHRILKEDGNFVLTVLNQKAWSNLVENGKEGRLLTANDLYVYLYEPEDLREELERAGFVVSKIMGINTLPARYLKRLGIAGVWMDVMISRFYRSLSIQKGYYLLASCRKRKT